MGTWAPNSQAGVAPLSSHPPLYPDFLEAVLLLYPQAGQMCLAVGCWPTDSAMSPSPVKQSLLESPLHGAYFFRAHSLCAGGAAEPGWRVWGCHEIWTRSVPLPYSWSLARSRCSTISWADDLQQQIRAPGRKRPWEEVVSFIMSRGWKNHLTWFCTKLALSRQLCSKVPSSLGSTIQ